VKIAAYNNHRSAPFSRALVDKRNQVYSAEGADDLIQSFFGNYRSIGVSRKDLIEGGDWLWQDCEYRCGEVHETR
jgi:hypothetical protein